MIVFEWEALILAPGSKGCDLNSTGYRAIGLFESNHLRIEMLFTARGLPISGSFVYNERSDPMSTVFLRWSMPMLRSLLIAVLALSTIRFATAQEQREVSSQNNEIAQGMEALRQSASSKTEFTLDHSMLALASKLDSNNQDLSRVIAGVSGVAVHRYRFAGPWTYDQDVVREVQDGYHKAGWMQLVNKHDRDGFPGATDLWIRWQDEVISNVVILVARSEEVTLVEVSGSISPLDLSHLGGHFGIPNIEGGVRVPTHRR